MKTYDFGSKIFFSSRRHFGRHLGEPKWYTNMAELGPIPSSVIFRIIVFPITLLQWTLSNQNMGNILFLFMHSTITKFVDVFDVRKTILLFWWKLSIGVQKIEMDCTSLSSLICIRPWLRTQSIICRKSSCLLCSCTQCSWVFI